MKNYHLSKLHNTSTIVPASKSAINYRQRDNLSVASNASDLLSVIEKKKKIIKTLKNTLFDIESLIETQVQSALSEVKDASRALEYSFSESDSSSIKDSLENLSKELFALLDPFESSLNEEQYKAEQLVEAESDFEVELD